MASVTLTVQDPDLLRSASHRNMATHLTGPFSVGAVDTPVAVTATGRIEVTRTTREPLIVVAPSGPLAQFGMRLRARLDPAGANVDLPPLEFAPHSEAGAFLPLHRPETDAATQTASPFTLELTLAKVAADGTETAVPAAQIAALIEVRIVEGVMGRLLYILGAEKARLRREAREIASMRTLDLARDDALDRMGADLGVARFADQIRFDTTQKQIVTDVRKDAQGNPVPEPDDEYRRRLAIYKRMLVSSQSQITEMLNGPGKDTDPNTGLLAGLGLAQRFQLVDEDNDFAFAVHLISAGGGQFRNNFLDYVRKAHLIHLENIPTENLIHSQRFLPQTEKDRVNQLRNRLRQAYIFPSGAALAPALAATLDRLGRCARELGITVPRQIFRAQDANGQSRFELGLGVELAPFTPAQLNQMRTRLLTANRPPSTDTEVEALLRGMAPLPAANDPDGLWLHEVCGLRTVHRVSSQRIYVSHLPTSGLVITGPSEVALNAQAPLEARFHAPLDPGGNAVLLQGMTAALPQWTAGGGQGWAVLTDAQARTRWDQATPRSATDPALGVFRAAGLAAIETPAPVVAALKRLPPELTQTITLAAPQAQAILAGKAAAADDLVKLTKILRNNNLASVLPLITGPGEVALVVGVIGLPEAGINLSERRATGFRWYVVPLQGSGGQIKAVGSRTVFVPQGPGVTAIVTVGYARRGLSDPYEFRVELPEAARINILQYEFLMNLLERVFPIGIEVNTFSIRKLHVDLDGDGKAEPLPPTISKTFRKFRRQRHRGEAGVAIESS